MISTTKKSTISFAEFVILVSLLMSLTALSIDAMLPALSQIGSELNISNPNQRQLIISLIFLGLAVGQLFFGPLSDKVGRKPAIYAGLASFLNARLVLHYGMRQLVRWALMAIVGLSLLALGLALYASGHPPLWLFMLYIMLTFFCIGILFGNMNALAIEPLGHVAGLGAAIVGALSTLISFMLGTMIGQSYNGTVLPLIMGLLVLSSLSILVARWADS